MSAKKPKEQRIAEIQKAAINCFSRKGYHETTMDDIVAESGLTKGGIYWYFKSKRDIFLSLLDHHIQKETALIKDTADESISIRRIIDDLIPASLKVHLKDKVIMPLFTEMAAEATRDGAMRRKLHSFIEEGVAAIVTLLERANRRREIKKLDYRNLSLSLTAFGYGLLLLYDISGRSLPVEEIWRDVGGWLMDVMKSDKKA